jgi:glycosyltransferase involved in cell wall biosynthesis
MRPRRILVVSEPMEYGVLSYLQRVFDGLDRSRWELGLVCSPRRMAPQGHRLVGSLGARGLRVRMLPFHRGAGAGDLRATLGLLAEARAFRPDLVHLHSTKAGLVGRIVAAVLGVAAVYTPHGTSWEYTGRALGALQLGLERGLRRTTALLVSVCPAEARAFIDTVGFDPAQVRVVPNGVPVPPPDVLRDVRRHARKLLGIQDDEVWLVFVGRLTAEKGLDVLLDALAEDVGAHGLLVVGDGADRPQLEATALRSRSRTQVRFCGYQTDVSGFLAAADVFVQPSRSEGLPFTLLEAMAHGLPSVCSDVGGIAQAVGTTGVVVPPARADALAASVRALANDPARRGALGDAARARVARHFGVPAMLAALEEAYATAGTPRAAASAASVRRRVWHSHA